MTEELFRDDAYLKTSPARLLRQNERGGLVLDQTIFYPTGGGQPGDSGQITLADDTRIDIATTVYDRGSGEIVHVPAQEIELVGAEQEVNCTVNWSQRHGHMRVHSALHLLCSLIPFPVTGGQISADKGRLDFDIPDSSLQKEQITADLNKLIEDDRKITSKWITDEELAAQPELVRTMSVKPPIGSGKVRLIEIEDCDLQPCGGTHVASTKEIGPVEVSKIEKKGAQNRRIRIALL